MRDSSSGERAECQFSLTLEHWLKMGHCGVYFASIERKKERKKETKASEQTLTEVIEIVGTAVKIGPKVTLIKEGSRFGVGAQSYSCLQCRQCKTDNETYCRHQLDTYGAVWPDTGIVSQGGYSEYVRTHEHWYAFLLL